MTIISDWDEAAALLALEDPVIETRLCFAIRPESTTYYFVRDTSPIDVNGVEYTPVQYAEFSGISSGDGTVADTMEIILDGENLASVDDDWTVDSVFQNLISYPLRDRPVAVSLAVLNPDTHVVVGLIPQFIGFVDNVPLTRSVGQPSVMTIRIASYRAFAQRRFNRVHSNTDHQTRFPGDNSAKWISSIAFRKGKFPWNSNSASANSIGGNANPNYYTNGLLRRLF